MTYNKKQKSYSEGQGTSHHHLPFKVILLRTLLFLGLLILTGVLMVMDVIQDSSMESLPFITNKIESKENVVREKTKENKTDDDEIYTIVSEMPRFPGCEDLDISIDEKKTCAEKKMLEYIYKNIKYPSLASDIAHEGMVVITFIVDKEGNIIQPKILRGNPTALGKEYIRIVKSMPKWIPGKQRGESVNVQFNIPFRINLRGN